MCGESEPVKDHEKIGVALIYARQSDAPASPAKTRLFSRIKSQILCLSYETLCNGSCGYENEKEHCLVFFNNLGNHQATGLAKRRFRGRGRGLALDPSEARNTNMRHTHFEFGCQDMQAGGEARRNTHTKMRLTLLTVAPRARSRAAPF